MLARGRSRIAVVVALVVAGLPRVAGAQSYTITPTPFQTALNNAGQIINNACIWTYTTGTSTPATTYSDTAGTANANPIRTDSAGRFTAYLLAGSNYKFVYESSCTPPSHGTTLRTADNILGVPGSAASVDLTGTAGENLNAGQCAYLSDGSGSKTAGQWYKCDSANAYSSTTPELGIAIAAITATASGSIRIAGAVPGLSSLSVGSEYFVGASGALTTTAPTLRRHLGHADTATSLVLTADPVVPTQPWVNDFRLTLTSGTPVTTSDVTAATTLYASPLTGNRIDLPDSNGNPVRVTSAEFSIAIPATTSQLYDVFAYLNGSAATLELLAWTNDTTRATAVVRTTNGRLLKSGDNTRLYLGSVRTTTVSGQTEDSATKRYVWNAYNRVRRPLQRFESTASWTYSTATVRQANGSTSNQVDVVIGLAEATLDLTLGGVGNNTAAINVTIGIGEDSTTTSLVGALVDTNPTGSIKPLACRLVRVPAIGRHVYSWNEWSAATATTTWWAAVGSVGNTLSPGLIGWIEG